MRRRRSATLHKADAPRLAVADHAAVAKSGQMTVTLHKVDAPQLLSVEHVSLVKTDSLPTLGYLLTEAAQRYLTESGDLILL